MKAGIIPVFLWARFHVSDRLYKITPYGNPTPPYATSEIFMCGVGMPISEQMISQFDFDAVWRIIEFLSSDFWTGVLSEVIAKPTRTPRTMKSTFRNLIIAAFAAGLVSTAAAAPPGKGTGVFKGANTQEEIQKLKKGDRYAMVCMDCKSITVKEVADEKETATLCHHGGSLHCDACKKKVTIKHVGPPGKDSMTSKVTYVNEKGDECMFLVPMKE